MPSSIDLKRKLKASAKRRSKRLDGANRHAPNVAEVDSVDVSGMIVAALLQEAILPPQLRDEEILAALRHCSRGSKVNNERAAKLAKELSEIPAQNGVSQQALRTAIDEMLALARGQKGSKEVNPFLRLLRVLAE